ncbi:DUF6572 domain-containing protein [Aliikangiella sp. IMCC44653]
MPIPEINEVDFVAFNEAKGIVFLVISDEISWQPLEKKLNWLTQKVNFYIEYINSGELSLRYPQAGQLNPFIRLVSKFKMPPSAYEKMQQLQLMVEEHGYAFSSEQLSV